MSELFLTSFFLLLSHFYSQGATLELLGHFYLNFFLLIGVTMTNSRNVTCQSHFYLFFLLIFSRNEQL